MNTPSSELTRLRSGLFVPEDEIYNTGEEIYNYFRHDSHIWIECFGKLALAAAANFEQNTIDAIPLGENTRKALQRRYFYMQPFDQVTCQQGMIRTAIAASMVNAEMYDAGLEISLQDPIDDSGQVLDYLSKTVK